MYPIAENTANSPNVPAIPTLEDDIIPKNYATMAHDTQLHNTALLIPISLRFSAINIHIFDPNNN